MYHGIGETLLFNSIGFTVTLNGPTSTSSSFEVAIHFSNHSQGLVVEFEGPTKSFLNFRNVLRTKSLSVDWLSDYGNEHEHLFIQSVGFLRINNIIKMSDSKKNDRCYEMEWIIQSLHIVDQITCGDVVNIKESLSALIVRILHHQISCKSTGYESFDSLNVYAQKLISNDFSRRYRIKYRQSDEMINKVFEHNVHLLHVLFPHSVEIAVYDQILSTLTMDNLLQYFQQNHSLELKRIIFIELKESKKDN